MSFVVNNFTFGEPQFPEEYDICYFARLKFMKMRLTLLFLTLNLLAELSCIAQPISLDQFFNTGSLQTASYCVYAIDAKSGEKIATSDQKSLSTASVMKLFTSAVALEMLGPDYTFSTTLAFSGIPDRQTGLLKGNLILKGGCDPAFYSSFFEGHYKLCFESWIAQMKKIGIKKIEGDLLLDLSALDRTSIPGGWNWDDIGNYYGAGVSALTFSDNLYDIHFSSPKTEGETGHHPLQESRNWRPYPGQRGSLIAQTR